MRPNTKEREVIFNVEDLNVIKTIKVDNVTIHICDNSIAKTEEENRRHIENFSRIAYELCMNVQKGR